MGLFDFFPYTSGHTLNLDWIIKTVKKLSGDFQIFKDEVNAKVSTIPAEVAEALSRTAAADINALPGIESAEYPSCYYRINGGIVEWLNPPLLAGIEYRTTERWNNKIVYTKLFDFGAMPIRGGAKDVSFSDDETISQTIRCSASTNADVTSTFPTYNEGGIIFYARGRNVQCVNNSSWDMSYFPALVQVWYVKN